MTKNKTTQTKSVLPKVGHTPGPWEVKKINGNYFVGDVCQILPQGHTGYRETGPNDISKTTHAEREHIREEYLELCNAHLIAAAPELLEAAKALVAILDKRQYGTRREGEVPAYLKLCDAIAKAEGGKHE